MSESPVVAEIVDVMTPAPQGAPCEACGCPIEPADKFCPACGASNPAAISAPPAERTEAPARRGYQCKGCGAEVQVDPDQRSYVCPFCDGTVVVEFSPAGSGRQPPEFVIGFAVTQETAHAKFNSWLKENAWFRPGDLSTAAVADKMKGVYLPFWSFSMLAESGWTADIGEHWYRTETYTETDSQGKTVTKTRTVTETEWWELGGRHHRYYSGYLISGSRGLSQADAERIKPFNLPALKPYEPFYLAGWLCEEYSIAREQALELCQQVFQQEEVSNIGAFLPGDTHRRVEARTAFSDVNSDLCLLPVYVLSWRYREKLYRFLVNGQTGKVSGDKPYSWQRIGVAIAVVVVLIIFFVFAVLCCGGLAGGL